ncbi:hypothetical protein, partial [Arthrobacter sp. H14]|uniref:hypothetical protein n=1 Tax=Arthrobacter sp. H14 TaxID=1312959 RepID=UPI00047D1C4E
DEPEHWNAWRILGDCAAVPEPHTTDTLQAEYWRMQLHCHGSEPDVMVVLAHNPAADGWRVQRISEC